MENLQLESVTIILHIGKRFLFTMPSLEEIKIHSHKGTDFNLFVAHTGTRLGGYLFVLSWLKIITIARYVPSQPKALRRSANSMFLADSPQSRK